MTTPQVEKAKRTGPARKYSLSIDQFQAVKMILIARNWTAERQQIAELYLVHGLTLKQIADMFDVSHQSVSDCAKRAWNLHSEFLNKPDESGLVHVVGKTTPEMAAELQKQANIAVWAHEWRQREEQKKSAQGNPLGDA